MDNFKREEIDRAVLQFLYVSVSKPKSKSKGTGFNDIKRAIGKGPETTSHSIKRLTNDKFVIKRGKYYYLSRSGEQLANGERSDFPSYKRVSQTRKTKRKIRDGVIRYWMRRKAGDQNKRDRELKRRLTFLVLWLAGNGVTFEINNNPLTDSRTYTITFESKSSKKPFTIGPATIAEIIEVLDKKAKVLKKPEAIDALTAIVEKYDELELAEVNDGITEPGYYWINNQITGYGINQKLEFDPRNNQDDRRALKLQVLKIGYLGCTSMIPQTQAKRL
jgi:hypothetical protein